MGGWAGVILHFICPITFLLKRMNRDIERHEGRTSPEALAPPIEPVTQTSVTKFTSKEEGFLVVPTTISTSPLPTL